MIKLLKFTFIMFLGVICCACMNTAAVHELNEKAAQYLLDGDIDTAISRLESSIDLDDKVYESRYNLAVAYMQKKDCKKALENITVALELEKDEPAVYYTHAVATVCVADNLYQTKDVNGENIPIEFKNKNAKKEVDLAYAKYLKEANISFDMYVKLAPNAEDTQEIISLMRENEQKITNIESQEF